LRSTRPGSERDAVVDGLTKHLKQMHSSLVPLAEEVQKELARRVGISPTAVASLREQIRQRILRFRAEG